MQIDLAGQVNNLRLSTSKSLYPLFEAVVNSVQAIEERFGDSHEDVVKCGRIEISIARAESIFSALGQKEDQFLADIISFEVTDNGVGFTDENYKSFDTSFSRLKARLGGKGVGRLIWLKAFNKAEIDSVYRTANDGWARRTFDFLMTPNGCENLNTRPLAKAPDDGEPRTTVKLFGFHPVYRDAAPKGSMAIAKRVVEHCLVLYMLDHMPRVLLRDASGETLDLTQVYQSEIGREATRREFSVDSHTFTITDVLLRASAEPENAINFCANYRKVDSIKLADRIAHAENPIRDQGGDDLHYVACVTGPFLDATVNQLRTGFDLDREGALPVNSAELTWDQIETAALVAAEEFLTPRLAAAREKAISRVQDFIEREEPRYRPLLQYRSDVLSSFSGSLSNEKLEIELHKALTEWRHDVNVEVSRTLKEAPDETDAFEQHKRTSDVLAKLDDVARSDLAEYVLHRRIVLDFMTKMLGTIGDGKFAREDVLHSLFFPMHTTSNHVDYDRHNLWLLDERLAFHRFLSSDVEFARQAGSPVRVDSRDRPDLLIYNHPMAYSEADEGVTSVVIVEFKKPEREDYSDSDNPLDQVMDYIEQINQGKALRPDGSHIAPPRAGTPFYCYAVVTITKKLRDLARRRGFHEMPDGQGFFNFNENYRAYIEIIDYRKVHSDALKRNKVFFEKLGLHTGVRPRRVG